MKKGKTFTKEFTGKIADLSKIKLDASEIGYFTEQFNKTLSTIDSLSKLNTRGVKGAHNITGLKNIFREDVVEKERVFTQEEALSNTKRQYRGYFVVKGIFDNEI